MTATLAIPRGLRHPSWYAPLLLPLLPALSLLLRSADAAPLAPVIGPLHLLSLGAILAFAVPQLIEHLGPLARKEAELLRPAWIAALLVSQVPLIAGEQVGELAPMFFAAACALLAAIPFGAEIQQRTLTDLLSQPVPRERWWTLKHGLLAGALATFWLTFLFSWLAVGRPVTPALAFGLLLVAALAWGTTPWWTLRTKGLLTGLVASLAVPLAVAAAVALGWDFWDRYGAAVDPSRFGVDILPRLFFVAAPVYTLAGALAGWRRWRRLEAPDIQTSEAGILTLRRPHPETAAAPAARRRPPLWMLFGKECRLQTLTLLVLGVTGLLAAATAASTDLFLVRDFLTGNTLLLAVTAVFLAGALPIAEERRLGTLDTELLQPTHRALQWWLKLMGAACLAGVAVTLAVTLLSTPSDDLPATLLQAVVLALTFFAPAFLASSVSQSAMRALVVAVVAATILVSLAGITAVESSHLGGSTAEEIRAVALQNPAALRAAAERLSDDEVARIEATASSAGTSRTTATRTLQLVALALIAPSLLALIFARLNFGHGAVRLARSMAQFGACLVLGAALCGVTLAHSVQRAGMDAHDLLMLDVHRTLEWEKSLSTTEHQLLSEFRTGPFDWTIDVKVDPPTEGHGWIEDATRPRVVLPLTRGDRDMLIQRGKISESLREGLREDEKLAPPPSVSPRTGARYGIPASTAPSPSPGVLRRPGTRPRGDVPAPAENPPRTP